MAETNGIGVLNGLAGLAGSRVLVTGGAGAIGNNLVRQLVRLGAVVTVVDDFSSGYRANLADVADVVRCIDGDIADAAVLADAFRDPLDYVFHLAALFANQNSVEHPQSDLSTNGLGTLLLLEKSVANRVRRFVFASSSCVYGARGESLDEAMPMAPDTPYAITKVLGEHYVGFFAHHHGLSTAVVRYFNSYGPGEFPGPYRNVIPNFFALAAEGRPLPITGTGEETRDFTFVADIVDGTLRAALAGEAEGRTFNLGTGVETPIGRLAGLINELSGNRAGVDLVPRRTWDQVDNRCADIGLARKILGFSPRTGLEDGLSRYWEWFAENRAQTGELQRR